MTELTHEQAVQIAIAVNYHHLILKMLLGRMPTKEEVEFALELRKAWKEEGE